MTGFDPDIQEPTDSESLNSDQRMTQLQHSAGGESLDHVELPPPSMDYAFAAAEIGTQTTFSLRCQVHRGIWND